jgi:hypothetical protein
MVMAMAAAIAPARRLNGVVDFVMAVVRTG